MKCSGCGSNNLINSSHVPFSVYGDARLEVSKNNIFICLDCGHIEFYNLYFVDEYKNKHADLSVPP